MGKILGIEHWIGKHRPLIVLLSAVVIFVTTYMLVLPAFTLDEEEAAAQGGIDVPAAEQTQSGDEEQAEAPAGNAEAQPANAGTLTSSCKDFTVSLDYDEDSGLTADTSLRADAILDVKGQKKEYRSYQDKALDAINEKTGRSVELEMARFYDISLEQQGQQIEPSGEVDVALDLDDQPKVSGHGDFYIVHFAENEKTGELETTVLDEKDSGFDVSKNRVRSVKFTADSFSVYGIVYTVDFRYDVDGETFEFSMDGGSTISLSDLFKALSIDCDVADVAEVEFSDPDLLVPVKIEEDTPIGKVKTALHLFPTYPLGLSQDEVLALNAKEYKAGDWALISMKAFDTEETLEVTMANGEAFKIQVTDAQDALMDGDRVQTISNPAGTTIDLFDYWVVSQDLVGRDGWGDLNQGEGWTDDSRGLNGTGNNKGINSSADDTEHGHALKFSPAWEGTVYNGTKNNWTSLNGNGRDGLNSYTGNGNPFRGIVQGTLQDGYPALTDNGTIGANGESLAYLYDPKISHAGKASYPSVNQLLYVDKNGYYTYDSRDYAARYDAGSNTFEVTEQTSNNTEVRGFWPFGTQNFWAGIHLNTQFSMPASGQVLNPVGEYKDMQFEFSGDDDTWLYVDGVLVGDGGGIHNRTEIDVNFAKGTVTVTGKKDTSHAGDFEETKYLDDIFKAAGKYKEDQWEDIGDGSGHKRFKAGTYHYFDMFYLERGGGESNLYIHYNLVSTADFTGHKSYYGADEDDRLMRDKFKFELTGLDGKCHYNGNAVVEDQDASDIRAIMPDTRGASKDNPGTIAKPYFDNDTTYQFSDGSTARSQTYITSVTEDGNINFGFAEISQEDMHDADTGNAPTYRYIIREVVPEDAVNDDGIRWDHATEEQKAAGGFLKNEIQYDGTVYYMAATVTSWEETNAAGQTITKHGLEKKYYTDDTFTVPKDDKTFVHFDNRHMIPTGNVGFDKKDADGNSLQGAKFALYRDAKCTIPATDMETPGRPHLVATSDKDGKVSFENVRVGTYYMKETEAPASYALDETVYKVVIEDARDHSKESKITIYGDESGKKVTEIVNTKPGKLTINKKWLDSAGKETDGGDQPVTVQLKRKHMVGHTLSQSHKVSVQMTAEDGGVHSGTPVTKTVDGDTVVIEWDDEWQRNFNWELSVGRRSYEGWIGDEFVETEAYTFEQISNEGRSRRLTIKNVDGDVSLKTKYWVTWLHSDSNHWNNLNSPVITGSGATITYTTEEDADFNASDHRQQLRAGNDWTHSWTLGGTESSHSGYDFPIKDDAGNNYLYYIVELDSDGHPIEIGQNPFEGCALVGYSANNNLGVSSQGKITVYNQFDGPAATSVTIKKTDDEEDSTNYLAGAVFELLYRTDASGTWVKAASVSGLNVEQLDENSKFTVPKTGIALTGLINGQYRLQEITPPRGYVITTAYPVQFTVENGTIANRDGTMDGVRYSAAKDQPAEFIIPNTAGVALPHTGGPGTTLFYIFGALLVIISGTVLISRRRIS